jgi:quercetin dioxygenase-like cupin family protein
MTRSLTPSRQPRTIGPAPAHELRDRVGSPIVGIADGEALVRREEREVSIVVALEEVTITYARCSPGERIAGPHVHDGHVDAFYVLEGELTFEIGRESESISLWSGGLVAVPPGVAHAFRTAGDRPARWLTIHAHDGGFAAFMRGVRDGVEVDWDIAAVPAAGGLSAREAIVSVEPGGDRGVSAHRPCWLRCALPGLCVVEWQLEGPRSKLPLRPHDGGIASFLVIEGELDVALAGTRQTAGPDTLISVSPGAPGTLAHRGSGRTRILSLHTPDGGFADRVRRGVVRRARG